MRPSVRHEDDLKELSVEETDMHVNRCMAKKRINRVTRMLRV